MDTPTTSTRESVVQQLEAFASGASPPSELGRLLAELQASADPTTADLVDGIAATWLRFETGELGRPELQQALTELASRERSGATATAEPRERSPARGQGGGR